MSLFVDMESAAMDEQFATLGASVAGLRLPVSVNVKKLLHSNGGSNYLTFGITVSGNIAYICQAIRGLAVIDLSDPEKAIQLGGFLKSSGDPSWWPVRGAAVIGDTLAFVVRRGSGFYNSGRIESVDVSTPANPVSIDMQAYAADFSDITTDGASWYVSGQKEGVFKYSNTAPMVQTHKNVTGKWETQGIEIGKVDGINYVFVSNYVNGVRILLASDLSDVASISKPIVASTGKSLRIWKSRLKQIGSKYFLFCCGNTNNNRVSDTSGLAVLDVTDPSNLVWLNSGNVIEITSGGDYGWTDGLGDKPDNDLAIYGDYCFIAHGSVGIAVFDIRDPQLVKYIGILDNDLDTYLKGQKDSLSALAVAEIGGKVYIISGDGVHNPKADGTDQIYIDEITF